MFLVFQILVIIILFNVLIAIVSDRYNDVMQTAEVKVRKLRAEAIIETHALIGAQNKGDEDKYPEYVETLQPDTVVAPCKVSELRAAMQTEVGEVKEQVDAVRRDVAKLTELVERMVPRASPGSRSPSPVKNRSL